MSNHYYADGSTHNDHHRELTINGNITARQLLELADGFLEGGKPKANEAERTAPKAPRERTEEAPSPLDTPEAMALWRIAREQGWVDEARMPRLGSDNKAAILASIMADALDLSPRWSPFEQLWGIKDLVHKHSQAKCCAYYDAWSEKFRYELN